MNILTTYFTASHLFTFVCEGMMYIAFNSVTLFTILYLRFLNCAKDVSTFTAQPTILELSRRVLLIEMMVVYVSQSKKLLQSLCLFTFNIFYVQNFQTPDRAH